MYYYTEMGDYILKELALEMDFVAINSILWKTQPVV